VKERRREEGKRGEGGRRERETSADEGLGLQHNDLDAYMLSK